MLENYGKVDSIYLNLNETHDRVPHERLMREVEERNMRIAN